MRTIYVVFGSWAEARNYARAKGISPLDLFSADYPDQLRGRCAKVVQVHNSDRPYLIEPARAKRWEETRQNIKLVEMKQ